MDNFVGETPTASQAAVVFTFRAERTGIGQAEKSALSLMNSNSRSKRVNFCKCLGRSVDNIRVNVPDQRLDRIDK